MNVDSWLAINTKILQEAGLKTARLDCLILLEDAAMRDRAHLLAHPELTLTASQLAMLNKNIMQRAKHIPLAYIRGHAAFYGRDFVVNNHVLVPRPETESMIDLLKTCGDLPARPHVIDVGTGSGCVGITAALELPAAHVFLLDVSSNALTVAQQNAQLHRVSVQLLQQDLLVNPAEHKQQFDVVLANLPYVPDHYPINQAAAFEPKLALFSGPDGLDLYRTFWQQLAALPHAPSYVITESLPAQHAVLAQLAAASGYKLDVTQGYVQRFEHL